MAVKGFFAKWYIIKAALDAPSPHAKLAVLLVIASVISAGYYLEVVRVMFMRPRSADDRVPAPSRGLTRAVIAISALALIGFGIFPEQLVRLTRGGAPVSTFTLPAAQSAVPLPGAPAR